jgi:hypothetical protein
MNDEFRSSTPTLPGIPAPLTGTALTSVALVERVSDLGADYFALEEGAPILVIQKDPYAPPSLSPKSILAFAVKPPVASGFQMVTSRGFELPVGRHAVIGSKGMVIMIDDPIIISRGLDDSATEVLFDEEAILARVMGTDLAPPIFCMAHRIGFKFARFAP